MDNIFNFSVVGGSLGVGHILFNLGLTLALGLMITYVYRVTHRGLSYSKNFVSTLILMSMITTLVMMVIGNSIAVAFGLLGAFSLVRFRTAVKETKDTGFIFFSLAEGMAVGTGNYLLAIVSTIFFLLVVWLLNKFNFGSIHGNDYLLIFTINHQSNQPDSFSVIFDKYLKNSMLLNINAKNGGQASEMVYSVRFVDDKRSNDMIKELMTIDGLSEVHVISSKADIEY